MFVLFLNGLDYKSDIGFLSINKLLSGLLTDLVFLCICRLLTYLLPLKLCRCLFLVSFPLNCKPRINNANNNLILHQSSTTESLKLLLMWKHINTCTETTLNTNGCLVNVRVGREDNCFKIRNSNFHVLTKMSFT